MPTMVRGVVISQTAAVMLADRMRHRDMQGLARALSRKASNRSRHMFSPIQQAEQNDVFIDSGSFTVSIRFNIFVN